MCNGKGPCRTARDTLKSTTYTVFCSRRSGPLAVDRAERLLLPRRGVNKRSTAAIAGATEQLAATAVEGLVGVIGLAPSAACKSGSGWRGGWKRLEAQ